MSGCRSGCGRAGFLAVFEAIALAVQLHDVDVMGQPIEQRASQPLGAEDLGPFVEGQIRGHQRRCLLVALGEDLEQQLGAGLRQRHVAELVDDQEILFGELLLHAQQAADRAFDLFLATFAAKFPAATTCLAKDRDVLLTFYAFPAEHWIHIRTTNPVESTFATVRLRTKKTKGAGSRVACLTMVFKLAMAAQKHWRALNGSQLIADVIDGVPFVDGVRKEAA